MSRLLLVLLVLAGCGGDDGASPVAPGPTTTLIAAPSTVPPPTVPPPPPPEGGQATFDRMTLTLTLSSPDVRRELALTPEQTAGLQALDERFADQGVQRFRGGAYADGALALLDARQLETLRRAMVRLVGTSALVDPTLRDAIGLDQAQKDRIVALIEVQAPEMLRVESQRVTAADRAASQKAVAALMAEFRADVAAVLTPAQAEALAAYGRGEGADAVPAGAPPATAPPPAAP